jgi:hypothetical protein
MYRKSSGLRKLHSYGLLRNLFCPPEEIRVLRSLWRLRDRHVKDAAEEIPALGACQRGRACAQTGRDLAGRCAVSSCSRWWSGTTSAGSKSGPAISDWNVCWRRASRAAQEPARWLRSPS